MRTHDSHGLAKNDSSFEGLQSVEFESSHEPQPMPKGGIERMTTHATRQPTPLFGLKNA